jgi:hypothetical protein
MKPKSQPRTPRATITVNGQKLSPAQTSALRAADQEAQSEVFQARARAAARLRMLEAQLVRDQTATQIRDGLAESLDLARSRGECVEVVDRPDPKRSIRIVSRDGLETLARSGAINAHQFRAGMLYRELYEATDPERDLRSQMTSPAFLGGGAGTGASGPTEAWAERRLRQARAIAGIEAKVRNADRNDRAVRVLREVAGHARCLSHFVKGGGAQAAHRSALLLALDVVAGHFGLV